MNRFGQHSLNQAANRFNPFAIVVLYISDRGRECSRGILLTNRGEVNVRCFQQYIFHQIIMIGFIRLHMTLFRDIKSAGFEHTHITL